MNVRRYHGEVRFLVSDFMDKCCPVLERLSNYPPNINLVDAALRPTAKSIAFRRLTSASSATLALGIDAIESPDGISMRDFREFLMNCFSLKRRFSRGIRSEPRALLILRRGSRSFVNEGEVIKRVKSMVFKLMTAGPEETNNMSRFARQVNSVDVLIGFHDAGLTDMVFLPANATAVQIIPCCHLADGCRYIYGEPAPEMGLEYAEYEIGVEESSPLQGPDFDP